MTTTLTPTALRDFDTSARPVVVSSRPLFQTAPVPDVLVPLADVGRVSVFEEAVAKHNDTTPAQRAEALAVLRWNSGEGFNIDVPAPDTYRVPSKGDMNAKWWYEVRHTGGELHCSCKAAVRGVHCWHIEAVRIYLQDMAGAYSEYAVAETITDNPIAAPVHTVDVVICPTCGGGEDESCLTCEGWGVVSAYDSDDDRRAVVPVGAY